jgi:RND family efflux transporter MFP subunit
MDHEEHGADTLNVVAAKPGKIRLIITAAGIGLGALFVMGELPKMHNSSRLAALAQEAASAVPDVTVVSPRRAKSEDLTLPGGIQAVEEAAINARSTGYLKQRFVDIGSVVKAGDVLAIVESPDLDQQVIQAQAQTEQSRATVRQSQADVSRQMAGLAQTEAAVAQQRAAVRQAQAVVQSLQSKQLQTVAAQSQAEAQLAHTEQTLIQQRANKKQAEAQLALAKITRDRYVDLVKQGFDTQQNLDQSEAAYKTSMAAETAAAAAINSAQSDVEASKQAVAAAKAAVASSKSDVEAAKESLEAAKSVLASAMAAAQAAQASVNVSKSTVQANQAAVLSSSANQQHYAALKSFEKVTAPFDGVITSRNVDVGALVNGTAGGGANGTAPSNGLFGIANTRTVRISVNVPQSYVNYIKQGSEALVELSEFPKRPFKGTVAKTAGALDATSRTLLVEVHIPNPDGALKAGMFAQIKFKTASEVKEIVIPSNTLIINAKGLRVALVENNHVHFTDIKTGKDYGTTIEVKKGLTGKETLISNPSDDLTEGQEVHPVKEAEEKKPGT